MFLFNKIVVLLIVLGFNQILATINLSTTSLSANYSDLRLEGLTNTNGNQMQTALSALAKMASDKDSMNLPTGIVEFKNKVAGHDYQSETQTISILKDEHDGSIIKPSNKPLVGAREIQFYENLQSKTDRSSKLLKNLIPEYRGTVKLHIREENITFIKLTDVTHGMIEPCVLDVKIGNRTWDPLTTEEKRQHEEQKYVACRYSLGFCIPGFQVYSIATGKIERHGKEYGITLDENTIKDSIRKFISKLQHVQNWARYQKSFRLYSSSLLLTYDAMRLRNYLQSNSMPLVSLSNLNSSAATENYKLGDKVITTTGSSLDDLIIRNENQELAFVNMIDFGHTFPSPDDSVDSNYLSGVESLIRSFEGLLNEIK